MGFQAETYQPERKGLEDSLVKELSDLEGTLEVSSKKDNDDAGTLSPGNTVRLRNSPSINKTTRKSSNRPHTSQRTTEVPEILLDLYFHEIGAVKLLSAEQEVGLAQIIEKGREARQKLATASTEDKILLEQQIQQGQAAFEHFTSANLRLVVSVAAQFTKRSTLGLEELIQEGNLGLMRAVEKFDWSRGFKFSTYATWWIRQSIQRGIAGSERTIRLPVALHDAVIKVHAATARLESESAATPTVKELAKATRLSESTVQRALEYNQTIVSLDQPVGYAKAPSELGEFVAVAPDNPAEEAVDNIFLKDMDTKFRQVLDERSYHVICRRYGLDGDKPATLDSLAVQFGLSRESVRKIELRALEQLKVHFLEPSS